ncbi:MAG: hypothetical protein AAGA32_09245 [Pseudomonadota bacterium]
MTRTSMRRLALSLSILAVAACSTPTDYAPASRTFGYKDAQLEEDRFRVSFAGNSQTPRDTVESYLLYRAAEVTLAAGKDWFAVNARDTDAQTTYSGIATEFSRFHPPHDRLFGGSLATFRPVTRYIATAEIVAFDGRKPSENPDAYDARSVLLTLGPTIVRPEPG